MAKIVITSDAEFMATSPSSGSNAGATVVIHRHDENGEGWEASLHFSDEVKGETRVSADTFSLDSAFYFISLQVILCVAYPNVEIKRSKMSAYAAAG